VELAGRHAVVTGGASGIGRALCVRFGAEGMAVVVSDVRADGAEATAASVVAGGGRARAVTCDVRDEVQVRGLVDTAVATFGAIDLFCSNAGIGSLGGVDASDDAWTRAFDTNFFAHVYAVRAVLPAMLERGEGYLLHTASAAGLLTQIGDLPYSVTKHAVVALAEWLAITYGDAGIKVSCLCPQGVNTAMLGAGQAPAREDGTLGAGRGILAAEGVIEPEVVADAVVAALRDERFLVLPHPEVAEYFRRKAADYDRWLHGMRRLRARHAPPPASG
jgi:NAD(P)-dependent dehydrogenase (short-subunit alcohol dehydrogenase family)